MLSIDSFLKLSPKIFRYRRFSFLRRNCRAMFSYCSHLHDGMLGGC